MDRDVALNLVTKLTAVKTKVDTIATGTVPVESASRSVSLSPELLFEPDETPVEPETRKKK